MGNIVSRSTWLSQHKNKVVSTQCEEIIFVWEVFWVGSDSDLCRQCCQADCSSRQESSATDSWQWSLSAKQNACQLCTSAMRTSVPRYCSVKPCRTWYVSTATFAGYAWNSQPMEGNKGLNDEVMVSPSNDKMNESALILKCVRKPTKSRLSLTHHANKSSRWVDSNH